MKRILEQTIQVGPTFCIKGPQSFFLVLNLKMGHINFKKFFQGEKITTLKICSKIRFILSLNTMS